MCLCVLVPGRGTGASRGALDLVVIDVINVEEAPRIEPVAIRLWSACLEVVGFFEGLCTILGQQLPTITSDPQIASKENGRSEA